MFIFLREVICFMKLVREYKKIFLIIVIILIVCSVFLILNFNRNVNTSINPSDFYKKFDSGERFILVFHRDRCYRCDEYLDNILKIVKKRRIKIYYIDTDKFSFDDSKIYGMCGVEGTPSLAIIDDKKMIDVLKGYKNYNDIVKFLKKNNF